MFHRMLVICVLLCPIWICAQGASVSLMEPTTLTVTEEDAGSSTSGSGSITDIQFCVQLQDPAGGLERDVILFIVILNQNLLGSARSSDFQTNQILTIPSSTTVGNNTVCNEITIIDDDNVEGNETITITMRAANSSDVIVGGNTVTVTIVDDDGASVSLVEPTTVTEGDAGNITDVQFCVQLENGTGGLERNIPLLLSYGGSAGSDDYRSGQTLTIPSSTAVGNTVCNEITIIDDDIVEGDETITITVSVENSNDEIVGGDTVTVTIQDDDFVDCGILMNPEDGQVNFTDTTAGANATYTCDGGFTLEGVDTRTCEADGQWSDSEPTCGAEMAQISLLVMTLVVIVGLALMGL